MGGAGGCGLQSPPSEAVETCNAALQDKGSAVI